MVLPACADTIVDGDVDFFCHEDATGGTRGSNRLAMPRSSNDFRLVSGNRKEEVAELDVEDDHGKADEETDGAVVVKCGVSGRKALGTAALACGNATISIDTDNEAQEEEKEEEEEEEQEVVVVKRGESGGGGGGRRGLVAPAVVGVRGESEAYGFPDATERDFSVGGRPRWAAGLP